MSFQCTCANGTIFKNQSSCSDCGELCNNNGTSYACVPEPSSTSFFLGVSLAFYIFIVIFSLLLFLCLLYFSIVVMRKCNNKPHWRNPTIIILLSIWILFSWVPGFGLFVFIILISLLIYFHEKCKKKIK